MLGYGVVGVIMVVREFDVIIIRLDLELFVWLENLLILNLKYSEIFCFYFLKYLRLRIDEKL